MQIGVVPVHCLLLHTCFAVRYLEMHDVLLVQTWHVELGKLPTLSAALVLLVILVSYHADRYCSVCPAPVGPRCNQSAATAPAATRPATTTSTAKTPATLCTPRPAAAALLVLVQVCAMLFMFRLLMLSLLVLLLMALLVAQRSCMLS